MKKTLTICALGALAGGAVLTTAPTAHAQVDCTTLSHPVYIAGSSASKPYLQQIAQVLPSVTLIYASSASCVGIGDLVTAGQTEPGSGFSQITSAGALVTCTGGANPYPAIHVDIGVSDVYPETCITPAVGTLPAGIQLFDGAVQAMEIVEPYTMTQSQFSISADAAYVVFGFAGQPFMGKTYTVAPWTIPTEVFTRGDTSGTQLMVASAIGLNGAKWLSALGAEAGAAQVLASSGVMLTDVETATTDAAIGILSNATVDPNKKVGGVEPLAFQAKGQDCGYYPDSELGTFDKINVRQGRYEIWGYEHFVTNVTAGKPVVSLAAQSNPVVSSNADVQAVINVLTHAANITTTSTPTLQEVVQAETAAYFIPQCAMQVMRTTEVGPEASYQPPQGCGCLYESLPHGGAGNTSSYCQTCTKASEKTDCTVKPYTTCNAFGYCEVQ
jgi:hypothetical protein